MNTNDKYGNESGRVNWFNSRRGYGFINVLSGDKSGKDIFIHQTNIHSSGYRILYPGEYVSFNIVDNPNSESESESFQCINVRGIQGGPLLTDNERYYYRAFEKERVVHNKKGGSENNLESTDGVDTSTTPDN